MPCEDEQPPWLSLHRPSPARPASSNAAPVASNWWNVNIYKFLFTPSNEVRTKTSFINDGHNSYLPKYMTPANAPFGLNTNKTTCRKPCHHNRKWWKVILTVIRTPAACDATTILVFIFGIKICNIVQMNASLYKTLCLYISECSWDPYYIF